MYTLEVASVGSTATPKGEMKPVMEPPGVVDAENGAV
jgi:hypothetical protein